MKYLFIVIAFLGGLFGAYKYGAIIGSEQTYLNIKAYEAVKVSSNLRGDEDLSTEDREAAESQLNQMIIEFGRYLDERSILPPLLFSNNKAASESMIRRAVEYRLENPRIIEGVEYSPFKKGWREHIKSPEFQVDLMELPESDREKIINDTIEDFQKKERWYRAALEYYGAK